MHVSTLDTVPGYDITKVLGIAQGNTIRAKHLGRDIAAVFKSIVGGELSGYTELLTEARHEALQRMVQLGKELGANAIVNVRFSTAMIMQGSAELLAYGTAVVVEPKAPTA